MLQKTSSLLPERENSCQKSEALDHMFAKNLMTGFVFTPSSSSSFFVSRTATFEPFVNLRCATWDSRQLPFADNYEHFIFPQSPGGVRAQFAFQNSSPCLTWAASLFFLSVAHPTAPLSSRPGSIPEDVRDFDGRSVRSDLAVTVSLWAFSGLQKDV